MNYYYFNIKSKRDLRDFLEYESKKYGRKNTRMPLLYIKESSYLWKYNLLLRKTEYHINSKHRLRGLFYKAWYFSYQNKVRIRIPINSFDKGLKIMHLGPIRVNGKVKAGKDVTLHINTGLVAGGTDNGAPTLGDGVVMGMGSIALGNIYIAKNVAVGANALVNKSFQEENTAIAGVPAKKISNNGRLSWNKKNKT